LLKKEVLIQLKFLPQMLCLYTQSFAEVSV